MNGYRSYFDRVRVSDARHRRIMDALDAKSAAPHRKAHRPLRYAALAACCALAVLAGCYTAVRLTAPAATLDGPPDTGGSGVALPPAPLETPLTSPDPIAPPDDTRFTILVDDPFNGQPHSSPLIPTLEYTDCTDSPVVMASIILPDGNFTEKLTAEEIIQAVGGTDTVPWALYWADYGLTGSVTYDGQGQVWQATIWGEPSAGGSASDFFTLKLRPGELPVRDTWCEGAASAEYDGVAYTAWYQYYDRDGDGKKEYVYELEFMAGDTGVAFQTVFAEQETAAFLCSTLFGVSWRGGGGLTTAHLVPDEIPEWRSDELTEAQAYEEDLGVWLPDPPTGFAFESAHRELGQNRDWLSIYWMKGYDYVGVNVNRFPAYASMLAPDFLPGEVTADALRAWGKYVDDDAGDTPGWRYPSFSVLYAPVNPDGDAGSIMVTYSIKGLTPEEAAELATVTVRSFCYPEEDG